jgi:hypothetical protein
MANISLNQDVCYNYYYEFQTPLRMLIVAPSGSGKTYRLFKIIEYARKMFDNPRQFDNVIYYYSTWTSTFTDYNHLVSEWVNKLPTEEEFVSKMNKYQDKDGCVMIFDDFMAEMTYDIVNIYTKYSRNKNTSVITLWQDLFPKGKKKISEICRTLSLSATDIIIFKNIRDKTQFRYFAKQFMPDRFRELTVKFNQVTNQPYSYLWFDIRNLTDNKFRVLSHVCLDEWPMHVYVFDIDI